MPQPASAFIDELKHIIQARKYSGHSMIQGLTKGEYDREHLKRWAIQKYFQVDQHILTDETQAQVWDAVKTFCDKWWRMQDGYYRVATGQGAGH